MTNFLFTLLVEEGIEDTILGSLQFASNYRERYGVGPAFFEGSLEDALKTAYSSKAKEVNWILKSFFSHI